MQANAALKLVDLERLPAPEANAEQAEHAPLPAGATLPESTRPDGIALASPPTSDPGPALPELVLNRLRELICEAPSGPQLEALVRVAERLPQWHSALRGGLADDAEVEGLTLEQAVSEVRRIADLAEYSLGAQVRQ